MPYTITHPFVSGLTSKSSAIAAGKVVPNNWNAAHTIAGSIGGNEVTNVPAAPITSNNVQSALNELASLIPSVGPGTDPLALIHGFSLKAVNPTFSGNASDRWTGLFQVITDCSQTDPQFSATEALENIVYARHGQNIVGAQTIAKQSFFVTNNYMEANAAGQKFVQQNTLLSYGMGDSSIFANNHVLFAGGPVDGDEGQAWGVVSQLAQQNYLNLGSITAKPAQSTVNTTTTQVIAKSKSLQTVNVASTVGVANGDWVIIEQQVPSGAANMEAVQVVSFTPTSITGVFLYNHLNGVTVTPALRISLGSTSLLGQDRVLVNMSAPSYSTGTVSSISGGGFTGLGTVWANNMVGGNATNIGVISLAADDYTSFPFDAGVNRLRSWYQISSIVSGTSLGIYTTTIAGDGSYHGKGPGAGTYIIRPAVRVLRIVTDATGAFTNEIICETTTAPWTNGDSVEQVICPYPDVTGFQYSLGSWTNGSTCRDFMVVKNTGARMFQTAFRIGDAATIHGTGADGIAFDNCFQIGETNNVAFDLNFSLVAAIRMRSPGTFAGITDAAGTIMWNNTGWIAPQSGNGGLQINPFVGTDGATPASTSVHGILNFNMPNLGTNTDPNLWQLNWGGWIFLPAVNPSGQRPYIVLENNGTPNSERGVLRWSADTFVVGTEKLAAGADRDMIVKTGGVEQLRFIAGSKIKFSGAPNFSANGAVATALTNVGPVGSNTTVQTWLTIEDNTGATRYIPCF